MSAEKVHNCGHDSGATRQYELKEGGGEKFNQISFICVETSGRKTEEGSFFIGWTHLQ